QGFRRYFNEDYEHYFFVADDMVLNPLINENNYQEFFQLSKDTSFLPEIFTLDNFNNDETLLFSPYYSFMSRLAFKKRKPAKYVWWRISQALKYDPKAEGVEAMKEIPTYEEALALLKKHGMEVKPLQYIDVKGGAPAPTGLRSI